MALPTFRRPTDLLDPEALHPSLITGEPTPDERYHQAAFHPRSAPRDPHERQGGAPSV